MSYEYGTNVLTVVRKGRGMRIAHVEYWDYDVPVYELSDYMSGDRVTVKERRRSSGGLPLYLNHDTMIVENVGRRRLKLSNPKYPR